MPGSCLWCCVYFLAVANACKIHKWTQCNETCKPDCHVQCHTVTNFIVSSAIDFRLIRFPRTKRRFQASRYQRSAASTNQMLFMGRSNGAQRAQVLPLPNPCPDFTLHGQIFNTFQSRNQFPGRRAEPAALILNPSLLVLLRLTGRTALRDP